MKKIIWIAVILCLLQTSYTFASTSGMSGGQGYIMDSPQNKMIYFYRSQEEIDKATMDDIESQLLLMGINPEENTFLLHGVSLRNDIGEYRTRVLSTKIVNVTGYPGNQPSGGIKFSSPQGGSFNYTPDGGPSKSVSVNFGSPYGTTSVSFTLGKRTDEVTSYSLSVPGYIYCKLWVEKKYTAVVSFCNDFNDYNYSNSYIVYLSGQTMDAGDKKYYWHIFLSRRGRNERIHSF